MAAGSGGRSRLRQLGDIHRNPPRLIFREQLAAFCDFGATLEVF